MWKITGLNGRGSKNRPRYYLAILSVILLALCSAGGTLAYLTRQDTIKNRFEAGYVNVQVEETFTGNVKGNVSVRNTGNVPVYIRAAAVMSWQDGNGDPLWGDGPEAGSDYQISMPAEPGLNGGEWILAADGFYYYTLQVGPGGKSNVLIRELRELSVSSHREEGKYLSADIQLQAIQAEPASAVLDAWGGDNGSVKSAADGVLSVAAEGGCAP